MDRLVLLRVNVAVKIEAGGVSRDGSYNSSIRAFNVHLLYLDSKRDEGYKVLLLYWRCAHMPTVWDQTLYKQDWLLAHERHLDWSWSGPHGRNQPDYIIIITYLTQILFTRIRSPAFWIYHNLSVSFTVAYKAAPSEPYTLGLWSIWFHNG